jgi:hypothetical protein
MLVRQNERAKRTDVASAARVEGFAVELRHERPLHAEAVRKFPPNEAPGCGVLEKG